MPGVNITNETQRIESESLYLIIDKFGNYHYLRCDEILYDNIELKAYYGKLVIAVFYNYTSWQITETDGQ